MCAKTNVRGSLLGFLRPKSGILVAVLALVASPHGVEAGAIAYSVASGLAGSQNFSGPLGTEFTVTHSFGVDIQKLGVFDSSSDGLSRTITNKLWELTPTSTNLLATLVFSGSSGTLVGGNRYIPLSSATLSSGFTGFLPQGFTGVIAAENYGSGEPNMNYNISPGGWGRFSLGAFSFPNYSRVSSTPNAFPETTIAFNSGQTVDYWQVGSFEFDIHTGGFTPYRVDFASSGAQTFSGTLGHR